MANTNPSPVTVRNAHTVTRMNDRASLDQRYRNARKNGVKGALTRRDLAMMCERSQRDS